LGRVARQKWVGTRKKKVGKEQCQISESCEPTKSTERVRGEREKKCYTRGKQNEDDRWEKDTKPHGREGPQTARKERGGPLKK